MADQNHGVESGEAGGGIEFTAASVTPDGTSVEGVVFNHDGSVHHDDAHQAIRDSVTSGTSLPEGVEIVGDFRAGILRDGGDTEGQPAKPSSSRSFGFGNWSAPYETSYDRGRRLAREAKMRESAASN